MSRLPNPGGDDGQWGAILNDYLSVELNADGSLKRAGDIATALANASTAISTANNAASAASGAIKSVNSVTPDGSGSLTLTAGDVGAPTTLNGLSDVNTSGATDTQILTYSSSTGQWTAATATNSGTVANASNSAPGLVQLAGDLGGNNNPAAPAITNGAITDAKVSASAAIAQTKISGLTTALAAKVSVGGDLGGTATAPTVAKVNGVTVTGTPTNGQALVATSTTAASWATVSGGSSNATTSAPGLVQLTGDLGGTATSPTVPGLAAKATDTAVVHNTTAETIAGVKTFSASPIVPTPTTGTQAANKAYVDSAAAAGAADASSSTKGILQLTGDLGGTATSPTVPGLAAKATDTAVVHNTTAETIAGVKTFSSSPIVPLTPTTTTQAASKGYVDTQISGVSGALTVKDEGTTLTTTPTSINFAGSGVTATQTSNAVTVTIPGGGGGGGGRTVTSVKTANYTPAAGEYVIVNSTGAGFTVTMPTGQASGATVSLKSISTNSNAVSIVPGAGDHIEDNGNYDGVSVSLNSGQTDMDFIYDGTSRWYRVG